ncbi:hypothetical protein BR93DRAFT_925414 [Coniochaeta sp. PMI_546]|nr:hypothetical protein BR93DRAFT_925414 [Coniochaeta sp. PMI_546]
MALITPYDVSIGLNLRGLRTLKTILSKASANCAAGPTTSGESYPGLIFHVQCCVNLASGGLGLLTSTEQEAPVWGGEMTLQQLEARVDNTIALLEGGAKPNDLDGIEDKTVQVTYGNGQTAMWGGREYILGYSIPNFMFHLCMAYSTLQTHGVDVGKMDFLLPFMEGMAPAP